MVALLCKTLLGIIQQSCTKLLRHFVGLFILSSTIHLFVFVFLALYLTAVKREKFAKVKQSKAKYFKVKVVIIFTVLSLIYYQYTVNLPNVLKVY